MAGLNAKFLIDFVMGFNKSGLTSGLKSAENEVKATVQNMVKNTSNIPWNIKNWSELNKQQLQGVSPVTGNIKSSTQDTLQGFSIISTKSTELLSKTGEAVGSRLVTNYRGVDGQIKTVTQTLDNQGKVIRQTASDFNKLGATRSIFQDWGDVIKKAFIVAPVWMMTRAVIQEATKFIQEGIQYYFDTEKAILNVTTSLQQMGQTGASTISDLTSKFTALSAETGNSVANIANIYAEVNRILGNTEKSFLATNAAVMLSEATGADAAKVAESVAFMYKLQGDSLKGATTDAQKFEEISALLYATQAKTPGGLEKLTADLKNFSSTMNLTDFGIENSIRLFGALGSSGITNSTVLRTGLMKVMTNIDEISKMLGLDLPKNTTSAQAFTAVLEKLSSAMKPGQLNSNVFAVIKDIFGTGARGAGQVATLAKDIQSVQEALSGKGASEKDRYLYKKQLEDVTNTAQHQVEIFGNLKKQVGETFISALVGGKDFAEAMKMVNESSIGVENTLYNIGLGLNAIGKAGSLLLFPTNILLDGYNKQIKAVKQQGDLTERIALALQKQLPLSDTIATLSEYQYSKSVQDVDLRNSVIEQLQKVIQLKVQEGKVQEANNTKAEIAAILTKKQADDNESLILQYAKLDAQDLKIKPGMSEAEISQMTDAMAQLELQKLDVRRKIELSQMTEEEQMKAGRYAGKDRELLLDINPSPNVKEAIVRNISKEQGFKYNEVKPPEIPFVPPEYYGVRATAVDKNMFLAKQAGEEYTRQNITGKTENNISIEPINLTVNIDTDSIIDRVKEAIVKELDDKKSELTKKVNRKIEDF